ncbi:MAG: hypothetical protein K0S38_840 [Candidatus Paceibacter sp.]|jgi:hypothetical protein|nr:hypothetical protein [Candidatus Paceibacter sp.]
MNQNMRIIIAIVIGIIIGFVTFNVTNKKTTVAEVPEEDTSGLVDTNAPASSKLTEEGSTPVSNGSVAIKVEDQNPGRVVVVYQVSLEKPGWVVIHEDTNGKPGTMLGARLFDKGSNSGLVELLRPMADGKNYFAVVYNDDGNFSFDPKKDLVIKDASGKEIMSKFAVFKGSDKPQ